MSGDLSVFEEIVDQDDMDVVKAIIEDKYGFTPPDEYIIDLMVFVNKMVSGIDNEPDTSGSYGKD
jgi:hypothetical protein